MDQTIVEWFGKNPGSSCGYCKSDDTSISSGMWAHRMSCVTYENLLNLGWRRSGKYCYKPAMDETCCPQYTIKCDVTEFKLSKSQKKVLKRMNKFLVSGERASTKKDAEEVAIGYDCKDGTLNVSGFQPANLESVIGDNIQLDDENLDNDHDENIASVPPSIETAEGEKDSKEISVDNQNKSIMGADPNKPKCRKAKDRKRENKLLKLSKKGDSSEQRFSNTKTPEKSIENFIDELPTEVLHKLEFSIVSVKDKEKFETTFDAEFKLYCKYQHVIHGDSIEDLTERQFRQFLVDGPLQYVNSTDNKLPSTGVGAFHYQYLLDRKLIAVGVIDILPHCLSSKYFFYDPDYMFLSLGTYSALREVYFIRSLNRKCEEFKYYYMGFYIDNCPKMKYKARYNPSFLLCPETYTWHPVEKCIPKFSVCKYCRLEEDQDKTCPVTPDINSVLVLYQQTILPFKKYVKRLSSKERLKQAKEVQEFVNLVGSICREILLYRS